MSFASPIERIKDREIDRIAGLAGPEAVVLAIAVTDDLALPPGAIVRIQSSASRSISGFVAEPGRSVRILHNGAGASVITFLQEDGGSAAENRVAQTAPAVAAMAANGALDLFYDVEISRWRIVSQIGMT